MEMSKDFEQACPGVRISINQQVADYTVILSHIELGLFVRDNQMQVADKNGDLISKTREGGSIGGNVDVVCSLIIMDWYGKAAEQGYPEAQFNVGLLYANGKGVKQDYAQAALLWRKGAGSQVACRPSHTALAAGRLHRYCSTLLSRSSFRPGGRKLASTALAASSRSWSSVKS
jgi:TPR repeat protein